MAGVATSLTAIGLQEAIGKLDRLAGFSMADLADNAGAILESSSKARFEDKRSPDGDEWADWSTGYAATRKGHHSLLVSENDLLESVQNYSAGGDAIVGSNLIHAALHQHGGEELDPSLPAHHVPKRPYLGLSGEDVEDLKELVFGSLERELA